MTKRIRDWNYVKEDPGDTPCFQETRDENGNHHSCTVSTSDHTGDHVCCCNYEWPLQT